MDTPTIAPPPGFQLDSPQSPPPPPGFVVDQVRFDNRTAPISLEDKASRLALFQQHQEEASSPNESLLHALAGGVGERLQGMGQAALDLPSNAMNVVEHSAAGYANLPAIVSRFLGITPSTQFRIGRDELTQEPAPLPFQPGQPTLPSLQFANEDIDPVNKVLGEALRGMTTPGMAATLPFAETKPAQALFAGLSGQGLVQGGQQALNPDLPLQQREEGGLNALINTLTLGGIGAHQVEPTPSPQLRPEDFRAGGVATDKSFGDLPIKTPEVPTTQTGISPPMEKRPSRPFDEPKNIGAAPVSQRIQSIVAQLSDLEKVMQERQIVPATVSGTAKAEPLGGQVSFAAPAEAGAIPSARQTAVEPSPQGKPLPEGWRVTVQQPMFMRPGKEGTSPGGVQIDEVRGGQNIRSTNPQTLREEGYEVPDFSKLPQGQYTSEKAQTLLREKSTAQTTSSFEATRPLPKGGGIAKGQAEKVRPKEGGSVINFLHPDFWKDNLGFAKTAQVEGQQLYNRVRNKLGETSAAFKALDMSGFKAFLATGNKTPEEVKRWVEENGPRVEVRKFTGTDTSEYRQAKQRWGRIQHDMETMVPGWFQKGVSEKEESLNKLYPDDRVIFRGWMDENDRLADKLVGQETSIDPTHWSTIAPKSETDMPGYMEGAVVVPHELKGGYKLIDEKGNQFGPYSFKEHDEAVAMKEKLETGDPELKLRTAYNDFGTALPKFPSSHSFPPNTLGFFRGYMETTPEGKKVFHVIEVQSDWAQNVRGQREREVTRPSEVGGADKMSHPLLSQWERLTLRAAIDHAKEQGADAIAISDAETAMMTEGHDRGLYTTGEETQDQAVKEAMVKQMPGMRLHYDTTLPRTLAELTGSKGERVGFGEHRMAFETIDQQVNRGLEVPTQLVGGDRSTLIPREDLIFREPSGEPKTSVTGKMFDLGSVPKEETSGFFGGKKPAKASEFRAPGPPKGLQVGVKSKGEVGGGSSPIESALKKALDWVRSRPEIDTKKWSPIIKPEDMKKELLEGVGNPMETKRATRSLPSASPETTIADRMSMLSDSAKGTFAKAYDMANKGDKVYSPVDVGFDMLDGGKATFDGPLFRNIRWPLDHDFNVELNLTKQNIDPVRELVRKGNLTQKNGERLGVYAAVQQGMRDRLISNGLPAAQIDAIIKSMSKAELDVYRAARTQLDRLLPAVVDVAKRVDDVDVTPVDNYFPLQRDWRGMRPEPDELAESRGGKDPMLEDVTDFLTADFTSRGAKPESGFTIERVKGAKTPFKLNFFDVYERHVRDVAHYVSSRQRLAEIAKLVRDEKFQDKYGDFGQKMVMDWLNTYAKQGRSQAAFPQIDWLRKAYARGVLGFRVASQLVHLSNVPLGAQRAGIGWYRRGLANAVSEGGQAWLQKNMAETFARGGGELELLEKQGPITKAAFAPQRFLDRWNAQSTALGIYLRELSKSGKDWRNFQDLPVDQKALAKARVEARRAVASPLYKDLPPALRNQLGKVLLQFQNTFMDQWSNIRYDLPKYLQTDPKRAMGLMTALVGMVLVESGIKYGTKKAEEELTGYHPKSAKDDTYWKKVADESLKRIPGAGQVINAYQFGSSGIPLADVATETVKGVKQFATAEDSKQKKLAGVQLATAAGEAAGLTGIGYGSQIVQKKMKAEMFKTHNQRLEESAGKPIEKMTMDERVSAEEKLKKETPRMSIGEESKAGQAAVRKIEDRKKELNEAMPKEFKGWAQSRDLRLPGYGDRVKVEGTEIVLTEKEMEHYKKLIQTSDNAIMGELKKDPEFMKSSPDEQRDEFNREIRAGRKNVHTQLIDDLQSGSIIEPNARKARRFSFLQEVE